MKEFSNITIPIRITLEVNFPLNLNDLNDENNLRAARNEPPLNNLIELGAAWKDLIKKHPNFILGDYYKQSKVNGITFGDYLI